MKEHEDQLIALSQLPLGQKALLVAFAIDTPQGEHIRQMGLFPGEELEVVRLAPLEETMELKIRGYFVSVAKKDASHIKVKLI